MSRGRSITVLFVSPRSFGTLNPHQLTKHSEKEETSADTVNIAVMGAIGSGKTTFVNLASGAKLKIGNNSNSYAQDVQAAPSFMLDNYTIHLIDTPGFSNTDRSEVEVLRKVASYLAKRYEKKLHGVIYLHDINTNRTGSMSKHSPALFRGMSGTERLDHVSIVTTHWCRIDNLQEGNDREEELATNCFRNELELGAKLLRHDDSKGSADKLIRNFLSNVALDADGIRQSRGLPSSRARPQDLPGGLRLPSRPGEAEPTADPKMAGDPLDIDPGLEESNTQGPEKSDNPENSLDGGWKSEGSIPYINSGDDIKTYLKAEKPENFKEAPLIDPSLEEDTQSPEKSNSPMEDRSDTNRKSDHADADDAEPAEEPQIPEEVQGVLDTHLKSEESNIGKAGNPGAKGELMTKPEILNADGSVPEAGPASGGVDESPMNAISFSQAVIKTENTYDHHTTMTSHPNVPETRPVPDEPSVRVGEEISRVEISRVELSSAVGSPLGVVREESTDGHGAAGRNVPGPESILGRQDAEVDEKSQTNFPQVVAKEEITDNYDIVGESRCSGSYCVVQ